MYCSGIESGRALNFSALCALNCKMNAAASPLREPAKRFIRIAFKSFDRRNGLKFHNIVRNLVEPQNVTFHTKSGQNKLDWREN
jgi:hypothetical protein